MPRRQRKERETRHGLQVGQAVELITDGKPHRPRRPGTVRRTGAAGFVVDDLMRVLWWTDEGKTWRQWAPKGASDAIEAGVGST